ncbi:MAG: FAD-binding oxidoreductase [Pseudomonadota bacterium]
MDTRQTELIAAVAERFGGKAAITDRDAIAPWERDWRGRYSGHSAAVLAPATAGEAAAIIGLARQAGVAVVPQGGNTSMVGGATPPADGSALILTTRRMNRVRSIDADAGLAVVEAGVILSDLHGAVADAGLRFPLTLGAKGSATIGGLVSTNAGGTQVLRWGTMRGLVAGLEAVLPDGSIHDGLAPLKKDNRGYDINQLLVGAEGTLGLVTAATLRLVPEVRARAAAWVGLASPHAALALLRRLEAATDAVESFELLPAASLAAVLRHIPGTRAPVAGESAWHVLIEAVASRADDAEPADVLGDALQGAGGLIEQATLSASDAQIEAFWRIRDSISEAERADGPAAQHDISVPVAAMPDFLIDAAAAVKARFPGTNASGFGHLGDGNVHFHVRAPAGAVAAHWYANAAPAITRFVNDLVVAAGGSISAEHGIGQMKLGELERLSSPARMAVLRGVKAAFDPGELFNPGKLVTLARPGATP